MRRARILAVLLAGFWLAACADDGHVTIVAFGDSTTHWRGPETNWVRVLRERLDFGERTHALVDAGVSSDTTMLARRRFWRDVVRHRPDVVTVQFGINDAYVAVAETPPATAPRVALEDYESNLRFFVRWLERLGSAVVLLTPNPLAWDGFTREYYAGGPYVPGDEASLNAILDGYANAVRRVAADTGVRLVDVQAAFRRWEAEAPRAAWLLDGVHPNDRAHHRIAALLEAPLRAAAALDQSGRPSDSPRASRTTVPESAIVALNETATPASVPMAAPIAPYSGIQSR